jgi:hypothetical protein
LNVSSVAGVCIVIKSRADADTRARLASSRATSGVEFVGHQRSHQCFPLRQLRAGFVDNSLAVAITVAIAVAVAVAITVAIAVAVAIAVTVAIAVAVAIGIGITVAERQLLAFIHYVDTVGGVRITPVLPVRAHLQNGQHRSDGRRESWRRGGAASRCCGGETDEWIYWVRDESFEAFADVARLTINVRGDTVRRLTIACVGAAAARLVRWDVRWYGGR